MLSYLVTLGPSKSYEYVTSVSSKVVVVSLKCDFFLETSMYYLGGSSPSIDGVREVFNVVF